MSPQIYNGLRNYGMRGARCHDQLHHLRVISASSYCYGALSSQPAIVAMRQCFKRSNHSIILCKIRPPSSFSDRACSPKDWRRPLLQTPREKKTDASQRVDNSFPAIVALGKFDALHRGHQALAGAAAGLGGAPWLVSFSDMAEVLGWPSRLPLVAPCDRRRVLETWKESCNGIIPAECFIPFADVRSMSPEIFVELLAKELRVAGVVVGSNYRFGYKAIGTAELLQKLAPQYGMKVSVVDLISRKEAKCTFAKEPEVAVSSSGVRAALAAGDLRAAALSLGRPYRLVADISYEGKGKDDHHDYHQMRVHCAAYNNQPPAPGRYNVLVQVADSGWNICHVPVENGEFRGEIIVDEQGLALLSPAPHLPPPGTDRKLLLDFV